MAAFRDVALAVATGSLALWLVSVAFTDAPPPRRDAGGEARDADADRIFDLEAQSARLRASLAPAPTNGRNPFRFGSGPRDANPFAGRHEDTSDLGGVLTGEVTPPVAADPVFPLALVGVAERSGPAGVQHTGVLAGLGQVFLVAPGDVVGTRYRVVNVGPDAVEVRDEQAGRTHHLNMRR
jgi:hypothetical protein